MKKLISGIIDYQKNLSPELRAKFVQLALGQSPDALLITCSDSRVAPNTFASTNPGDLFVVRNVGNMVPKCGDHGLSIEDQSEAAALEFASEELKVSNIIICGHSECGAMQALLHGRDKVNNKPHLQNWLEHGEAALEQLRSEEPDPVLAPHNRLSQLNVLQQIEHLKTYSNVNKKVISGELKLHGWWFDIKSATIHWYIEALQKFIPINEDNNSLLQSHFNHD